MKRLILLAVLLLTVGCGVEPRLIVEKSAVIENTNRSDTMLQGMTRKMMVYKQDDIIKTELRNTKIEVDKAYSDYISDGYTIYDISAKGGLTYLSAETPGKYLCVWKDFEPTYLATPDTGTAQAGSATTITLAAGASAVNDYYNGMVVELTGGTGSGQFNIITAYNGGTKVATVGGTWGTNPNNTSVYKIGDYDYITAGDVTIHTDVVIMGVKLDAYNRITNHTLEITIVATSDYTDKLLFQYIDVDFDNTGHTVRCNISGVNFRNSNILGYVRISTSGSTPIEIKNCNIIDSYEVKFFANYGGTILLENCYLKNSRPIDVVTDRQIDFKNCFLDDVDIDVAVIFGGTATCNFYNTMLKNSDFDIQDFEADSDLGKIIYVLNTSFDGGDISTYIIKSIATTNGFIVGKYEIDFSKINFSTFYDLTADWSHDNIDDTNYAVGYQHLDYYNAVFLNNYELPDELKKFSKDYLFVVKRDDFEADLLNATGGAFKIKNFTLYENDGTTLADFQAMENFLIKATDGTDTVVFLYMDNVLYGTIFTDIWDDTTYTITQCFQLWKVVQAQGINNLIKQYSNPKANPKSPLGGNVRWNNWDNEVRVKQ